MGHECNVNIRVKTDTDKLNRIGLNGSTPKEILDNAADASEYDNIAPGVDFSGPKEQVKDYTVLGKKFGMTNRTARGLYLVRDADERCPEFAKASTIPDLYITCVEWAFEEKLKGHKFTEELWPDVEKWMKEFLAKGNPGAAGKYTDKNGNTDEYTLLSDFGSVIFWEARTMLIFY